MGFILILIIGGVIGWLASLVMKTSAQMGIIANIVVGIIGAELGFWLAGALGIVAVGSVGAWIISIIGAVVLLAILKALNLYKVPPSSRNARDGRLALEVLVCLRCAGPRRILGAVTEPHGRARCPRKSSRASRGAAHYHRPARDATLGSGATSTSEK